MSDNDADQTGIQDVPPAETPPESQRNLAAVLLSDFNTVAVTTVSTVAGAYALKKILGGGPGGKDGDGHDPEADAS